MKTYYEILDVKKESTDDEIKKAYRKLAMKYHPDRNDDKNAEVIFKEINDANDTLSNKNKRQQYDESLRYGGQTVFNHGSSVKFTMDNINDIFTSFRTNKQPSGKQVYQIQLTLEAAYTGVVTTVEGTSVNIPRGVRDGNRIYLPSKVIHIYIPSHKKFKRSNDDLLVDMTINAFEAMLGVDNVQIILLDGSKLRFKIPPAVQVGQVIRLAGKGMPNPEVDTFGDLLIRCNITIPRLTDKQKCSIINIQNRKFIEI